MKFAKPYLFQLVACFTCPPIYFVDSQRCYKLPSTVNISFGRQGIVNVQNSQMMCLAGLKDWQGPEIQQSNFNVILGWVVLELVAVTSHVLCCLGFCGLCLEY